MARMKAMSLIVILVLSQVIYVSVGYPVCVSASAVNAENVPPFVEVLPDVSAGKAPLFVRFECNAWDEDGEIAKVEWDLEGDGIFERARSVKALKGAEKISALREALRGENTFLKPGIFHILVKVTDDRDTSSVSSVTIKVYSDTPFLDIIPCDRQGFAYMARSGYEALFTGWMGEGTVQFEMGEAFISYEFRDQAFGKVNKTRGVAEGNKIWYYNVYENVDVRYTVYEDLLLEELIVRAPVSMSVVEQSFTIRNVEYKMEEDGSIGFYNGESLIFTIPKPVMYELNNPEKKSYGLHYEITESENGCVLRKVIDDTQWLQKAKYPIVIDSSTQGEIADPWEQQGLTPYGQYFKNLNEYVDPMTGHLTIRHTDYSLPGRGLDVTVTRIYSTVVAYRQNEDGSGEYIPVSTYQEAPTDLGCGWSLDLPWMEIDDSQPGYMHATNGTQKKARFVNGVWEDRKSGFVVYKNTNGTYTKYRKDGIREEFNSEGRLVSMTDMNGNTITFTYAQIGYTETGPKMGLSQITDTVGRVITFSYSGGKLISITDGVRTTTYGYSGDRLVAVTDPLGRTTTYDYLDAAMREIERIFADPKDRMEFEAGWKEGRDDACAVLADKDTAKENAAKFEAGLDDDFKCLVDHIGNELVVSGVEQVIPSPVAKLPSEVLQAAAYIARENFNLFVSKEYEDFPPPDFDQYCCEEERSLCAGTSLLCIFIALAAVIAFMRREKRRSP